MYRTEEQRGYDGRGSVWSPGYFTAELQPDCTRDADRRDRALAHMSTPALRMRAPLRDRTAPPACGDGEPAAREGLAAELVLAADSFIITPVGRLPTSCARMPRATRCAP
jgi:hypothetical protein